MVTDILQRVFSDPPPPHSRGGNQSLLPPPPFLASFKKGEGVSELWKCNNDRTIKSRVVFPFNTLHVYKLGVYLKLSVFTLVWNLIAENFVLKWKLLQGSWVYLIDQGITVS